MDLYPHCTYGGLHISEQSSKQKEGKTMCNFNAIGWSSYSYKSSMKLVYYQYPEYDTIAVSLSVKTTKCKSVEINLCYLHYSCSGVFVNQEYTQQERDRCNTYLRMVSNHLSINLHLKYGTLYLSRTIAKCVILQFTCTFTHYRVYEEDSHDPFYNLQTILRLSLLVSSKEHKVTKIKIKLHKKISKGYFCL